MSCSQFDDHTIVKRILAALPAHDLWCVEFGAWDGVHLSNTCDLIRNHGYTAVLIEANQAKYNEILRNHPGGNVTAVNARVGFDEHDNLDQLLSRTAVPIDFDFLSIDIDGYDYQAWKAVERYKPKVVCVEFNPTMSSHVRFIQPVGSAAQIGSSPLSIVELGGQKEYTLVAANYCNLFFVKNVYSGLFEDSKKPLTILRSDESSVTHFFTGYDGSVQLIGNSVLPWHGVTINKRKQQILPRLLQKFPDNYNLVERLLFHLYLIWTRLKWGRSDN